MGVDTGPSRSLSETLEKRTGRQRAASHLWGWGTLEDLFQALERYGVPQLRAAVRYPKPRPIRLLNPFVTLAIASVMLYQRRAQGIWPPMGCVAIPNCSNFAIGPYFRYGFLSGTIRAINRVRYCNGRSQAATFNEFHTEGFDR